MKPFFSIELLHEYDQGTANHLSIVPARSNHVFINNNRLWFRSQTGFLECYIEDDESLKNEIDLLFFWVVCTNQAFYSYTDYPGSINFNNPYYYWRNSRESSVLHSIDSCDLYPGKPPKQAIGLIGMSMKELSENKNHVINFNVRKTIWQYNILPRVGQQEWVYKIEDDKFHVNNEEWLFKELKNGTDDKKVFQSTKPIPYYKDPSSRFKLKWAPKNITNFQEEQQMVLPFANYSYKTVDEDNKELTPVFIHI